MGFFVFDIYGKYFQMVNTVKNSKIQVKNVYLVTPPIDGLTKIDVVFSDSDNIFVGKTLSIKTDNDIYLNGVVGKSETSWYINLDVALITGTEYVSFGYYDETFTIELSEDNAHVTFSDIHKNMLPTPSKFVDGELIEKGISGLIDGDEKYLLDNEIIFAQKISSAKTINNLSTIPKVLCNVLIPNNNKTFTHGIVISNDDLYVKLNLQVSNHGDVYDVTNSEYSLRVDEFSSSESLKEQVIKFSIQRKFDVVEDLNYLIISAVFDNTKLSTAPQNKNYFVEHLVSKNTLFYTDAPQTSNSLDFKYNLGLLYVAPVYSTSLIIDRNTSSISLNGVVYINNNAQINSKLIEDFSDLNEITTQGNYYMHNGNINSLLNKPTNDNQRFNLVVVDMNRDNVVNEFFLSQTYVAYFAVPDTIDFELATFERVSTSVESEITWSNWLRVVKSNHTHVGSDIIEDETHRFATDENITNWNKIYTDSIGVTNTWKLGVELVSDLLVVYPTASNGWNAFVNETSSVWRYNGNEWFDTSRIVSETNDGLVSKVQFNKFFVGSSQSKNVNNKTNTYVNRGTENTDSIYGVGYQYLNNNNIDLVKRTEPILTYFGEYSYQQGFNVLMFGNDNYGVGRNINGDNKNRINAIGLGLNFGTDDQTIIGSYNVLDTDSAFIVGGGTSDADRRNLFRLSKNGEVSVDGGYVINGKTNEDIVLADGNSISKSALLNLLNAYKKTVVIDYVSGTQVFTIEDEDFQLEGSSVSINGIGIHPTEYIITLPNTIEILSILDSGDWIELR